MSLFLLLIAPGNVYIDLNLSGYVYINTNGVIHCQRLNIIKKIHFNFTLDFEKSWTYFCRWWSVVFNFYGFSGVVSCFMSCQSRFLLIEPLQIELIEFLQTRRNLQKCQYWHQGLYYVKTKLLATKCYPQWVFCITMFFNWSKYKPNCLMKAISLFV